MKKMIPQLLLVLTLSLAVGCQRRTASEDRVQDEDRLALHKQRFEETDSNKHYHARCLAEFGEPGIRWLLSKSPGTPEGELEEAIGIGLLYASIDVYPILEPMLRSHDAQECAFALRVAGQLIDKRYMPAFRALEDDERELPFEWLQTIAGYAGDAIWMFEWKELHPGCFKYVRDNQLQKALTTESPSI